MKESISFEMTTRMGTGHPSFKVIDLFCGAGGLSLGFSRAGFEIALAIDHDPDAVITYAQNIGTHVERLDIAGKAVEQSLQADVIIGGPPCQGFSSAGARKPGDARNSLVQRFAELVAHNRPSVFVFENVEGFLTAEHGKRVFELLTPVIQAGYRLHVRKVNAANFGVPQHRKRVIVIGRLGRDPGFPAYTHSAYGAPGAALAGRGLRPTPTIMEAWDGLPNAAQELPGVPQGHVSRRLSDLDLERITALRPGQTMRDLPATLQHISYPRRAYRRVMDGSPTEKRGGAPTGLRRLRPDEPSKAITGSAATEFIHPFEDRPLTIRECARLQTFPDSFVFSGGPSSQMQLIGNAIPPWFAQVIASSVMDDLLQPPEYDKLPGKLLTFVPTLSSGMSPLLRQITEQVQHTFDVSDVPLQMRFEWD